MTIVTDTREVPIRPQNIRTDLHFFDAFNNHSADVIARWIVDFCKERNSWAPFTLSEIESFCRRRGDPDHCFSFSGLDEQGFIKKRGVRRKRYCLTLEFISICDQASRAVHSISR